MDVTVHKGNATTEMPVGSAAGCRDVHGGLAYFPCFATEFAI